MSRFSERNGYVKVRKAIIREEVSSTLRIGLWNILSMCMWDEWGKDDYGIKTEAANKIEILYKRLWFSLLKRDMDDMPPFSRSHYEDGRAVLKQYFLDCKWYTAFDFLEFVISDEFSLIDDSHVEFINKILKRERSAYRVVGKQVVEITDENEIKAIEDALLVSPDPVKVHFSTALSLLSDKENPDYRNSIKESISAVESCCKKITGNQSGTLGQVLKKVDGLHPALNSGFAALYGFTSDASGIRHALMDESNLTYADAKFMLSACSAFVSYLMSSHTP
jgi:hypothetical protein